ncbi:uncharacterized protein LOC144300739 [Canis aureus]
MGQQPHENLMDAGDPRDKELPGPIPREAKKLRQETWRADKWIKMLKRWDFYLPSKKGSPLPGESLLGARASPGPGTVVGEMKEAALVSSRDIMQIDLDVNRTFCSHTMFWDRYGVGARGRGAQEATPFHGAFQKGPRGPQLTRSPAPWGVLAQLPSWDLPGATVRPPTCPPGGLHTWRVPCSLAQLPEAPPAGLRTGALAQRPQGSEAGPGVLAPKLVRVAPTLWEPPPGARAVREPGEPDAHGEGSEGASGRTPSVGPWLLQEVGYCQGMSEIAAIVLMFLPEEDAFWALAQLMTDDRHAMHGRGADVHRHLYPKMVPAVLPRPGEDPRDPRSRTCPLPPGRAQLSPTPQTSQARPWGPEAEARSPARPREAQRVPGRGSGGRAVSASAPPGEAGSARGVDGPSAHRAASLGSSRGVVSSSAGRVCAPRGAGGAGRGWNPERPGALISLGGGHAGGAVGPRRRQPGGRWQA